MEFFPGSGTASAVFKKAHPRGFFVNSKCPEELAEYLRRKGWLAPGDGVFRVLPAGDGNMNLTLRLWVGPRGGPRGGTEPQAKPERTLIVKQARPWCEKFPEIPAPPCRMEQEVAFLSRVGSQTDLADRVPAVLGWDPESQLLVLEDLGEARDLTWIYSGKTLPTEMVARLAWFLARLHSLPVEQSVHDSDWANLAMRKLNWEYIFLRPTRPAHGDGAPLGQLSELQREWITDARVVSETLRLGEIYLGEQVGTEPAVLLHGDFIPAAWLEASNERGLVIIDGEFSFIGPAEWDLGVWIAHLWISELIAKQSGRAVRDWVDTYREARRASQIDGSTPRAVCDWNLELALQFAGAEIARRVLGVSQLPLEPPMGTEPGLRLRQKLLARARSWILKEEGFE